ncbi:uncharacterized protein [Nicotiana tomentosiformis]|uniref:uncharacterized protein n=1 Tax=Nicotiana tomentosiformis TaxID=4098 RepID=UPI00388C3F4F
MRDCPNRDYEGMAKPASSATGSSMSMHPSGRESQSLAGRDRGRGRGSSSGDPGSTLSYITPFIAGKFGIVPEIISDSFAVSTPVRESIIARRVYRGCTVTVYSHRTSADLVELEMMDFDAIMGMDWLAACYATVDCRAKAVRFHFPRKANVVENALSRRSMGSLAHVEAKKRQLAREIHQLACLGVRLVDSDDGGAVLQNTAKSSFKAKVKERQYEEPELIELRERVPQQK